MKLPISGTLLVSSLTSTPNVKLKPFRPSHLERRYNIYYAVLDVPKDVRHVIGKRKYFQSTKTGDIRKAQDRADALVLAWKAEIQVARSQPGDPMVGEALDLLNQTKSSPRHLVRDVIDDRTREISALQGDLVANQFRAIALGEHKPLSGLKTKWIAHDQARGLKPKTTDQASRDIELLTNYFPTASAVTPATIKAWIELLTTGSTVTASSLKRILGTCRGFFRYLKDIEEVQSDLKEFFVPPPAYRIGKGKNSRAPNKTDNWLPFAASDIPKLHAAAVNKGDISLANLIVLGAYTGARIEELCSLKLEHVDLQERCISIVDAKTDAGCRIVPMHSQIFDLISMMADETRSEMPENERHYLITGLTFNKYGDRSNGIGKRFGRLKTNLGYSDLHVFHSIRKTVGTRLENAGVPENVAADILGHEKPRITYGIYSGGTSLAVMREAIEKIHY
ncbi:tyrosine-type recombinase/integrase [Ralstonia pseudosolanacearum]|uniref:tyrosine-type recombinase/integrase n=1 Tax=Ralstonia pseudosolanacearum TaxID=1310165 RepID=UPI0030F375C1